MKTTFASKQFNPSVLDRSREWNAIVSDSPSVAQRTLLTENMPTPLVLAMNTVPMGDVTLIPNTTLLLEGEFHRVGNNLLIIGPDGERFTVEGYFATEQFATLTTPNGRFLLPETVERLLVSDTSTASHSTLVAGPDMVSESGTIIGKVGEITGKATARNKMGVVRNLAKGDAIFQEDLVETLKEGQIKLIFRDNTSLQLGGISRVLLEQYIYDQKAGQGHFEVTITRGMFRYVSGDLAKQHPGQHTIIKTPSAQVGIRGSELQGEVTDGRTVIVHTSGVLDVADAQGQGVVTLLQTGTATVVTTEEPPQEPFVAPPIMMHQFIQQLPAELSDNKRNEEKKEEQKEEGAKADGIEEKGGKSAEGKEGTVPEGKGGKSAEDKEEKKEKEDKEEKAASKEEEKEKNLRKAEEKETDLGGEKVAAEGEFDYAPEGLPAAGESADGKNKADAEDDRKVEAEDENKADAKDDKQVEVEDDKPSAAEDQQAAADQAAAQQAAAALQAAEAQQAAAQQAAADQAAAQQAAAVQAAAQQAADAQAAAQAAAVQAAAQQAAAAQAAAQQAAAAQAAAQQAAEAQAAAQQAAEAQAAAVQAAAQQAAEAQAAAQAAAAQAAATAPPETQPLPPATSPPMKGVLLGMAGVAFRTATQSGITGEDGSFCYNSGEMVAFLIGHIVLGQAIGGSVVTPINLAAGDISTARNILRLLQTLDDDNDPTNGITITASTLAEAYKLPAEAVDVTVDESIFAANESLTSFLTTVEGSGVLISAEMAWSNFQGTLDALPNVVDFQFSGGEVDENSALTQAVVAGTLTAVSTTGGSEANSGNWAYQIVGGEDAELFGIDGNRLTISAGTVIDHEAHSDLHVQVMAIDQGGNHLPHLELLTIEVADINDPPTLTSFGSAVQTIDEDRQATITLTDLLAQGNATDQDDTNTVCCFVVQDVITGTLKIGAEADSATVWVAGSNDIVDATHNAYWTGAPDANGLLDTFTVVARDGMGAHSSSSVPVPVRVMAVPDTTIGQMTLAADTGLSATDFQTNVEIQTLTATLSAELLSTEILKGSVDDGANWIDITDKVGGTNISWDGVTLVGSSAIHLKVTDLTGRDGEASVQAYTLDTTAPTTTINALSISTDTGIDLLDFKTNTAIQTIAATLSGELKSGEILYGSVDSGQTWTAITDKVTSTALTWSTTLLSGTHSIQIKVTDAVGNDGIVGTQIYTLDTLLPTTIVNDLDISDDTGGSATDFITNEATQTITANLNASLAEDERLYGSTDEGSTWTDITNKVTGTTIFWDGAILLPGSSAIHLKVVDVTGNEGPLSVQSYELVVASASGSGDIISAVDISTDTGSSATDFVTNVVTQTITGTLTTQLAAGENLYGSLDGGEEWSNITSKVTDTTLSWDGAVLSGNSAIQFKVTDAADNDSTIFTRSYWLDTTTPTTTISGIDIAADTGSSSTDFITNAATQAITGTLSAALTTGELLYGSIDGGSTWSNITSKVTGTAIFWNGAILSGSNSIKFKVADAAGNEGTTSTQSYVLDTTAPATTINNIDISADNGSSSTDFITNAATQTITGALSAALTTGDLLYGSTNGGSTWSDITSKVAGTAISWDGATLSGSNSIRFKVADAAGNEGTASTQSYVLDTVRPSLNTVTPAASGRIAASGNLVLQFSENVVAGTGTIILDDGYGDWRGIAANSANVTISGGTVTLDPGSNLYVYDDHKEYGSYHTHHKTLHIGCERHRHNWIEVDHDGKYVVDVDTINAFKDVAGNPMLIASYRLTNFTVCASGDPLVLDLNGDGIHLTASDAGTRFDMNGDGVADFVGWIGSDDGLLVLDRNGDGQIETLREVISEKSAPDAASSLAALATLDSNQDGLIDANDKAFIRLQVWVDQDQDGVSMPQELFTLSQLGITRLGLTLDSTGAMSMNGNTINGFATVGYADGHQGAMAEVQLEFVVAARKSTPISCETDRMPLGNHDELLDPGNLVATLCGGSTINVDQLLANQTLVDLYSIEKANVALEMAYPLLLDSDTDRLQYGIDTMLSAGVVDNVNQIADPANTMESVNNSVDDTVHDGIGDILDLSNSEYQPLDGEAGDLVNVQQSLDNMLDANSMPLAVDLDQKAAAKEETPVDDDTNIVVNGLPDALRIALVDGEIVIDLTH